MCLEIPSTVQEILARGIHAVCIDFDSTIVQCEVLDELAKFLHCTSEFEELTNLSMEGKLDFTTTLQKRINMLNLKQKDIDKFLIKSNIKISDHFEEFLEYLKYLNIQTYIVSGCFLPLMIPILQKFNFPLSHVFCNKFLFIDGIATVCPEQLTCTKYGKSRVLQKIIDSSNGSISNIIMIGDGITDLYAKPPATIIIGYGGCIKREIVRQKADIFVESFQQLTEIFKRCIHNSY